VSKEDVEAWGKQISMDGSMQGMMSMMQMALAGSGMGDNPLAALPGLLSSMNGGASSGGGGAGAGLESILQNIDIASLMKMLPKK
jgi:hypothetical protein